MSDQNPYNKLGVTEDASFDEIQDARSRLVEECTGDQKRLDAVEAAYDAILMERLRMRQEGKIKVPEGIRFAERFTQAPPTPAPAPSQQPPAWLQGLVDQPSSREIALPGLLYLGLVSISWFYQAAGTQILQLALVVGVGSSIYFLNRKEGRFGRAVLLTTLSLIVGLIVGGLIGGLLQAQLVGINLTTEQFSTIVTFGLLWLVSSFLR